MQVPWIFQIDWIFWDTIIIFLLIIFLISVKIFKNTHRWRNFLSNPLIMENKTKNFEIQCGEKEIFRISFTLFESKINDIAENNNNKTSNLLIIFKKRRYNTYPYAEALASIDLKVVFIDFKKVRKVEGKKLVKIKISGGLIDKISKAIYIHFIDIGDGPEYQKIVFLFPNLTIQFLKISTLTNFFDKFFLILSNFSENYEILKNFLNQDIIDIKKLYFIIPLKRLLKLDEDQLNKINRLKDNYKIHEKNILILEKSFKSLKNFETIIIGFILNNIFNKK
ncbi:MAG: hypothetical protein KAX10_05665 [Candidatus Lokiarchaeota archaeon]|nr:hypothetical protein [Candidatus Lokiarchaeota archaeon]